MEVTELGEAILTPQPLRPALTPHRPIEAYAGTRGGPEPRAEGEGRAQE